VELVGQTNSLNQKGFDISLAIAEALGDFREEPEPLVKVAVALDPMAVPAGACPKCVAVRSETAASCPCCGLAFGRFHPSLVAPSEGLLGAFIGLHAQSARVEDHVRLLSRAQLLGELPQVVRLYRILLTRDPNNQVARQVVEEAVKLASAPLAVAPAAPKSRVTRNLFMVFVVLVFLATVTIKTVSALH
jgi:hypothetical protein